MAFRMIQNDFWTDSKIVDDFSPEDKYFYLYLLTTPLANSSGCYEVSIKTMAEHLGWNKETVEKLLERFEVVLNVIRYSRDTKEILILNWAKYNWTDSPKFRKGLEKYIKAIKNPEFKAFLTDLNNGIDTVSIPYAYTVSLSLSNNNSKDNINNKSNKTIKHKYGEYKHVRLTENEYNKLLNDLGQEKLDLSIKILDEYCEMHGKTYTNYNLVLRGWVQNEVKKRTNSNESNIVRHKTTEKDEKELSKFIRGE